MAYKVFLGVGHGGTDTGAVADGYREKDMTLVMALACQEELARHGVLVKLSRVKDENDPVNEEVRECNAYAPDLALDIHVNAGGGDGFEAYYTIGGGKGKSLALAIEQEVKALGRIAEAVRPEREARAATIMRSFGIQPVRQSSRKSVLLTMPRIAQLSIRPKSSRHLAERMRAVFLRRWALLHSRKRPLYPKTLRQ